MKYIRHRLRFGYTLCTDINPKDTQMLPQSVASFLHIAFISAGHLRVASDDDTQTQIVQ